MCCSVRWLVATAFHTDVIGQVKGRKKFAANKRLPVVFHFLLPQSDEKKKSTRFQLNNNNNSWAPSNPSREGGSIASWEFIMNSS